jgi:putative hydrolase of the HAD superfamily
MASIDTVFVDVGGVLLLPPPEAAWTALGAEAPLDLEAHRRAHVEGMIGYDRSDGVWGEYLLGFCRGYEVAPEKLRQTAGAVGEALERIPWSVVDERSRQGLRALSEHGFRLAIVSNSDGTIERQLRLFEICQTGDGGGVCVEAVIDSHVLGLAKPDPAIFHHVLGMLGAEAGRAAHIGDSVHADVGGARAAGVRPLHFDPLRRCDDTGHEHLHDLADAAAVLG